MPDPVVVGLPWGSLGRAEARGVDGGALSALLSVLADLPDGAAVGQAVMQGVLGPYGCDLALVYAQRTDGSAHDLVAGFGLGQRETAIYSSVPTDSHLPGAEAARTGVDRIMPAGQVAANYPLAAPFFRSRPPQGDIAFMVLRHRGAPLGFCVLGFREPLVASWHLRVTMDALLAALSLWLLTRPASEVAGRAPREPLTTSPRQREVLVLVREGFSNREIAVQLGYSVATVKADITAMSAMLGARGRADLIHKAALAGL